MATTTLVTGATGFLGSQVTRLLSERGDDVRVAVRAGARLGALDGLAVRPVTADVGDRRALRRAMRGVDRVFHVAEVRSLRVAEEEMRAVLVGGTRAVLGEALRAGVGRVVLSSSAAAVGPAPRGATADEMQVYRHGLGVPYADARHAAEHEALRVAARGLELVTVCPTLVLGAGDTGRSSTEIVRRFMLRRIPAAVEGAINVVDVADAAAGHLLADERGAPGERYILGTRNYTWERLFADLGRHSGIEPPLVQLPLPVAIAVASAAERAPGPTPFTAAEMRAAGLWWAFRSGKARRELGWTTRPHEDTVEETVAWYQEREGGRLARQGTRQPLGLRLASRAARDAGEMATWLGLGRSAR